LEATRLSEETIRKTLRNFGLTEKEAEVYIFLAKRGVLKGGEISKQTKTQKALIYRILKSLQTKGLVESTLEFPARFTAVPFENIIDLNIHAKQEEAARIAAQKRELLNYWQNIKKTGPEPSLEKFMVIEGKQRIYHKLSQMIGATRNQLSTVMTMQGLVRADQFGLFDDGSVNPSQTKISFRFLTELSNHNTSMMKKLLKTLTDARLNFEVRTPELGLNLFPQMAIRDQEEAIFFITQKAYTPTSRQDDVCLWTNCKSLVGAFSAVFEDLWSNSTDIKERIDEIETGKVNPKMFVIGDAEIARKKYNKAVQSAKEEIVIMTSSKGLIEFWQNMPQLKEWTEKGLTVRVMAPILSENLEAAKQLSRFCHVKHVPPNYKQTTIIDGKHLFQFKTISSEKQLLGSSSNFEKTFYTNDPEYVQKMKTMLNELWKNGRQPLADNLESIFGTGVRSQCGAYFPGAIRGPGPQGTFYPLPPELGKKGDSIVIEIVDEDPFGKMTEQDVLDEIINAQKIPPHDQLVRVYSSQAIAIIHPPDFFNLPSMLIRAHHIEKHSTLGEQDVIMINLWLETPNGHAYVPVAVLVNKPKAKAYWRRHFAASPAGRNVRLAKKDELQIRVHGNTLFAGWTVPIPLLPSQYVLPPACILVEGYGEVKTAAYSIIGPSAAGFTAKQNGFDAFVTFMHPSSKYSGPGTDGFFVRDFVGDISPNILKSHRKTLGYSLIKKRKPR
jgi:sugar-specific transcriptional regulator TrmB